jgi:hypothetical protein
MALAAHVEVNEEALQKVRAATGWLEPVLRYERLPLWRYGT